MTTGDPARAEAAAKMCDSYKELAYNREFRSFEGIVGDQKITIISHGVGSCGAMICWEELVALGAKVIIRAGSCGSLHPDKIKTGDIHIPYAVGRAADITDEYLPTGVPAVASLRVVEAIRRASDELGIPTKLGLTYSCGLFYGGGPEHNEKLKLWSRVMDTVECEFHGLYLIGLNRRVMTGGIAVVDGSPLQWEDVGVQLHRKAGRCFGLFLGPIISRQGFIVLVCGVAGELRSHWCQICRRQSEDAKDRT